MNTDVTTTAAYKAAEVYEQFIVRGIFRYWTPLLLQRASPQTGEQVLDVACGTGVVARSMVPLVGPQGAVTGVDINPAMLAVACQQFSDHCEEVEWREGRAEDLPVADDSFDLVTCQQGLQFFVDKGQAVREMRRVLRPGGRVAIAVWQSLERNPFYLPVFTAIAAAAETPVTGFATPFAFGDPAELERLLTDAGFRQVNVETVAHPVYFDDPARYVDLTIKGAGAVVPAFAQLDGHSQSALATGITAKLASHLREHTRDGVVTYVMHSNIATGYC